MKSKIKRLSALIAAILITALAFFACDSDSSEPAGTTDITAPADVRDLTAAAKDSCVLLTWTDAQDNDIFGYEVTYAQAASSESKSAQIRAISAMEKGSIFVAQDSGGAYVNNLTNGTEYTFTVKAMDTSGNKSSGVSVSSSPKAASTGETLKIVLSASVPHENGYTGDKSSTTVTITAVVTSAASVKNAVYKKNGSVNAAALLSDTSAIKGTQDGIDSSKWTFTISAKSESEGNGTYIVAAIDEAGREETAQISIKNFDFTAPANVTDISSYYDSEEKTITLTWKDPVDTDFDHILVSYTTNDGTSNREESTAVSVEKGKQTYTLASVDSTMQSYRFTVKSVDELGNTSGGVSRTLYVYESASKIPEDFVKVAGGTFAGTETLSPSSSVFIKGRKIEITDLYVCDHEVTQKEYETYCIYRGSSYGPSVTLGKGENYPAYGVTWYDAVVYCNLRSIAEGLIPAYSINNETNPSNWTDIRSDSGNPKKYGGPYFLNNTWNSSMSFNESANGYRLPTEAEWEYIARGGSEWKTYTYSGSNTIDDVAWYKENSEGKMHEVKRKTANSLGIYDMSGNAFEWCWDGYASITESTPATGPAFGDFTSKTGRIYRGGGYSREALRLSVYYRNYADAINGFGFRVVRNAN